MRASRGSETSKLQSLGGLVEVFIRAAALVLRIVDPVVREINVAGSQFRPRSFMESPTGGTPDPGVSPAGLAERLAGIKKPLETTRSSTGLSLPLPGTRDSRNQFNLAKARADAAAAAAAAAGPASSLGSTYRSRRQSGSSQVSYTSKTSYRSTSQRKGRKTKKGEDLTTGENVPYLTAADPFMEELGAVGQVFDENGKDVTPKPLVQLKPTVLYDKLSQANAGRVSPTNVEVDFCGPTLSRTGYSITSSAGSLTPETVEGEELDRDDGTMSVKSRSLLGTSIGIPEIPKIIQVVMAPVSLPTTQKVCVSFFSVYYNFMWML
ncbi:hypothetical protein AXG93_812s1240 [Marchantia polymorpha subsp. ruderalis]|uniref:Uncharacterized protein n=1 Tax=Marchantia polymorpha subsp. ruderalis TaxID=1480154 RepID=A0A176VXT7_MARPO|nr:hypothetical protein AXG93_812s1240 [Marchantia polymorpha subsp. ruderalis]